MLIYDEVPEHVSGACRTSDVPDAHILSGAQNFCSWACVLQSNDQIVTQFFTLWCRDYNKQKNICFLLLLNANNYIMTFIGENQFPVLTYCWEHIPWFPVEPQLSQIKIR